MCKYEVSSQQFICLSSPAETSFFSNTWSATGLPDTTAESPWMFHWPLLSRPFLHTDGSQCMGGWQGHCPVTERCVPRIFCWDDILYVGHCTLNRSKVITGTPIFAKSPWHHCRMETPSFGTWTPENRLESTHTQWNKLWPLLNISPDNF